MSCERARPVLLDLALGTSAPDVESHLAGCAPCRFLLEDERRRLARIDGELRASLDVSPSLAFVAGARRRAADRPRAVRWWAPVAATVVALLVASVVARRGPDTSPAAPSPPPREARQMVPERAKPMAIARAAPVRPLARAVRRPRSRPDPAERFTVLVDPAEERAFGLLIERLRAVPDDTLAGGLRVSEAVETPFAPLGELPPVVIAPLPRSDS